MPNTYRYLTYSEITNNEWHRGVSIDIEGLTLSDIEEAIERQKLLKKSDENIKNVNKTQNTTNKKMTSYDNSKRRENSTIGQYEKWLNKWNGKPIKVNTIKKKFKITEGNWNSISKDKSIKTIKKERNIKCKRIKGKGNDYYLFIE